jgi:uncharacterized protein
MYRLCEEKVMVICISPAKTFSKSIVTPKTTPIFEKEAFLLAEKLKRISIKRLSKEMHISDAIAQDVKFYYQSFGTTKNSAIHLYDGQAFKGIDVPSLNQEELAQIQDHLYILSGLYGLVRPLDGISRYRLEMKSRIILNLEHFWKKKIHDYIEQHHQDEIIFNLASDEYGKLLSGLNKLHTIELLLMHDGKVVQNNMAIKKARGMMARHLILNHIDTIASLKTVEMDGFIYQHSQSTSQTSVFIKTI